MDFSVRLSSSLLQKMGWDVEGYDHRQEQMQYFMAQQQQQLQNENESAQGDSPLPEQQAIIEESQELEAQDVQKAEILLDEFPTLSSSEKVLQRMNTYNEKESAPLPTITDMLIWEAMQREDRDSKENLPLWDELQRSLADYQFELDMIDVAKTSLKEAATNEGIDQKREKYMSRVPFLVWINPLSLTHCYDEWNNIKKGNGNYFRYRKCIENQVLGERASQDSKTQL
uniref:Uncharacterized protein n=1 Tax=Percolomonas cosmopolitus TaxID=63605 RepID=A0A7S1KUI7_9EUKA|mmetsp:Transcript_9675/g.35903  ORF Transcript_9675/g.35903 Transcript_9675/m.35903 type:complete len:228 (+) Transcript_9675:145-828(+)